MNKRPKRTDSEADVLQMQNEFLSEKAKNEKFQPAAQVVRIGKKQSLFSKSRNYKNSESIVHETTNPSCVILGDIIEKSSNKLDPQLDLLEMDVESPADVTAFPKVEKIASNTSVEGKSLFALSVERKRTLNPVVIAEELSFQLEGNYGHSSTVVEEANVGMSIHEENLKLLSQMKKEEILEERAALLQSLDPSLLRFIEEKRKQKIAKESTRPAEVSTKVEKQPENLEASTVFEILKESEAEKWIHFDVVEKEKLEWMKDVPAQVSKPKPGEKFEARFDWKGVLLPYTDVESSEDNRELYFHGEEPHRPGYTLQELFRLCRSNIIQQRISAFGAISGILNIYNQGFYDSVVDLPITKLFFLLRFGFDENSTAALEVISKSLAALFYNDTDEVILDIISETSEGYLQPIMAVDENNISTDHSQNIENAFSKLKLTSSPFTTNIEEDDEDSKTSMNDLQLAETDLIECLLRTNIVQRISYVLGIVRPQNSTVFSCLKVLIRIARTDNEACFNIASNTELVNILFDCFLPRFESIGSKSENDIYNFPQYLVLKLFRVMLSQHISLCINLSSHGLLDRIKGYLFSRENMKIKLIKVQIESLRILRAMLLINMDGTFYRELLPAFRYLLEWHYQHVVFAEGGSFLIRQHASALINVIYSGSVNDAVPVLGEILLMCSCKWFHEASKFGIKEFSQSTLLSSCLNCVARFIAINVNLSRDFINKYLRQFLVSKSFFEFESNLSNVSILLKEYNDRRNFHPPLPNLGSILLNDGSPQLVLSQTYPVYFIGSLLRVIETLFALTDDALTDSIMIVETADCLTNFLQRLSNRTNRKLATSFLAKSEIKVVFKLLCFKPIREILSKETILQAAFNLLCCMTSEHVFEIEILFRDVIFSEENLRFDQNILTQWRVTFLDAFVYPHRIVIQTTDVSLSMPRTQIPILASDWPYLFLKSLLNNYLQGISKTVQPTLDYPERDIISVTFRFAALLEENGLKIASPTETLMYLMIAFMGPDSQFLEPNMKILLRETVQRFFYRCRSIKFELNATFEGKSKFENLYVLFLDHFQAASYGDETFGSLVLVPLSQKYDNKWRKIVWSEHASVLRFLNCDETQLLGTMDDYLQPVETDESLVKCYARALHSNLLQPNTIPHKIAQHHVNHFRTSKKYPMES